MKSYNNLHVLFLFADERKLQDLSLDLDVKTRELKNYLLSMNKEWQTMTAASLEEINKKKEEFQSMTASSLNEINRKTEEGKQVLKEAVSKASLQQGQREIEGGRVSETMTFVSTLRRQQHCFFFNVTLYKLISFSQD